MYNVPTIISGSFLFSHFLMHNTYCNIGVIPEPSLAGVGGFLGVMGPGVCGYRLELDGGGIMVLEPGASWLEGVGGM